MKIFVQSVPTPYSAYSLNRLSDPDSGRGLNKTKYGRTFDRHSALYSGKVGGLLNGLSYKPWFDENGKQKTDQESGRKLTLQDREEQRWNLPKGFLSNKAWRKGDNLNDLTYYQKTVWKLEDGSTVLDVDNNFDDAMFYYVLLDSKYCANSEKELKENKWPFATHFIALTNESDEIQYANNKRRVKAFAQLEDKNFNDIWKLKFIQILELSSVTTSLTDEQVENILYKYIDSDNGRPGHNIDRINNLFSQLKTEDGRKTLDARHLIRKGLESRVIYEKSDTFTWNRSKGIIVLGDRYEDAISFILNPTKKDLVEELDQEIKTKMFR